MNWLVDGLLTCEFESKVKPSFLDYLGGSYKLLSASASASSLGSPSSAASTSDSPSPVYQHQKKRRIWNSGSWSGSSAHFYFGLLRRLDHVPVITCQVEETPTLSRR
ncbi:hypothetical protein SAY86_030479 [Trapa natans]|uniref:Uncharacterized protein n=1 Tax=Trapa natans TaxID=22666 RepID=A0AAN7RIH5_TRANT|nr:hypothetical protein SAY86_030479 [Trapa natans]